MTPDSAFRWLLLYPTPLQWQVNPHSTPLKKFKWGVTRGLERDFSISEEEVGKRPVPSLPLIFPSTLQDGNSSLCDSKGVILSKYPCAGLLLPLTQLKDI